MNAGKIELLVVAGCPNEAAAASLLESTLRDVGLRSGEIVTTVIDTQQEADRCGFLGSPTILIYGRDPFAEPGQMPALACRVYQYLSGPSGLPDVGLLRESAQAGGAGYRPTVATAVVHPRFG